MKKILPSMKRIFALLIVFGLVAGLVPAAALEGLGVLVARALEPANSLELNNGYIKVTVSEKTGGFGIRTVEGDKVNKFDDEQYLVFEYDEDNTSFTSFRVTRNGQTKEYIFGGKYPGSSGITVTEENGALNARWSVDDLTFIQTITLVNTGSTEHGTALISYSVENRGDPAQVKCRILMDTALGYQDYAYYKVGSTYLERETELAEDGYNKSFYAATDPYDPRIIAYTINASVDSKECKPYRTVFAHWNNLASTVFDYTPDTDFTFTNYNNRKYLTSDSAYALYFGMGEVATGGKASIATNYGVYSNESVSEEASMAVNVNAPDVLQFARDENGVEDQSSYENGGKFSVKTYIENISNKVYSKVRIVVYAAGGMDPLDAEGNPTGSTYDSPYSVEVLDVTPGERLEFNWEFVAEPKATGQYGKIHYKIYDICDDATLGTGQIMQENLLGEGHSYILCPGSVEKAPALKFTGSSPDTIFSSGLRTLYVTGENFSMLADESSYKLMLSRVDGNKISGETAVELPASQVQIDDSTNVMTVIFTEDAPGTLVDGMYQLTLDYTDTTKEDISGQALRFHVSSEVKYRNDSYGFLVVVKEKGYSVSYTYSIQRFADEDAYWEELESGRLVRQDVLLEFRGSFIRETGDDGSVVYQGVSLNGENNVMTMNGSLDIKDGTTTITEKDGSITVDFDADLYTTGSGTSVWSGMCALTELEAGTDYSLITYDENGNRTGKETGEPIALLWPSVGQHFQNLMGMLFNLKYGEMGVIAHENAPTKQASETRVLSFGAAMNLGFLIPKTVSKTLVLERSSSTKDILGSSWDAAEHNKIKWTPAEIRALNKQADYRTNTVKTDAKKPDLYNGRFADMTVDDTFGYNAASIVVDDVLFGGEYLGVNLEVVLGIPPYIEGLPALEGILSVRTVGDWTFSVDGECHFTSFRMEAGIALQSLDGVPILDRVNFFIGGIRPGINVDGVGVLWLQGAGGGIDNLYETVVLTDSVPPLKLIIQAQISVLQILTGTATLGLSLRGIDVSLSDGRSFDKTNQETGQVIQGQITRMNAGIRLDWYPEFYLQGYVNLLVAKMINGGGYVVADAEGFFEFFVRASVDVPLHVSKIGGLHIAEMNLGVSDTRLWGRVSLLDKLSVGLVYYWGGEMDWNSGSEVYPTYPELVGMDPGEAMVTAAVDHNEQTNQTLYMSFGTNVRASATTMGRTPATPASGSGDKLESDVVYGTNHTMTLWRNGSGKMLSMEWTAETLEQAQWDATTVVIADQADSANQYPITIWDKEDPDAPANGLLAYNEETKVASLTVVFAADDPVFGTTWNVVTPAASQLVVYDVAPMPEITAENAVVEGNRVSVDLGGTQLEKFTELIVFAEGKNSGQSYLLGGAEDPFATNERTLILDLPQQMVSDTYTLRIVATDDNDTYYSEVDVDISYTNPEQPSAPTGLGAENVGDYKVAVTVGDCAESFDGYQFTACDAEGNVVNGMDAILMYKDGSSVSYGEDGMILPPESSEAADSYVIGGHLEQTVETEEDGETTLVTGFSAGEYTIEVRRWKRTENGAVLVSEPTTVSITVREPVRTVIRFNGVPLSGGNSVVKTVTQGDGKTYEQTVFSSPDVLLRLTSETESFTGTWYLDGGYLEGASGQITEQTNTANVTLNDLKDGTHMISFEGKNSYGDGISAVYQFTVDTQGPRLLLAEPVNGSLFDYWTGKLNIAGVTDADSLLTVWDNTTQRAVYEAAAALETDEDGRFTQEITLDRSLLSHDLTITVADALGNESSRNVSVMSNGLGSIEKLMLFSGENDVTNTKLTAGGTHPLSLVVKLKRPADADPAEEDLYVQINMPGMVDWVRTAAEGQAELADSDTGVTLTTSSDAEGLITARFLVNDQGDYSVSAAFGFTGDQIRSLNDGYTQVITTDQIYTGKAQTTDVEVWYRGIKLTEGTDYIIGEYTDNVDVTTESRKAQVEIIGLGTYTGTVIGQFEIRYLELNDRWITISGVEGDNGFYVSDVSILPAPGYEFVVDGETAQITMTTDGEHTATFRVRCISDGTMTDVVVRTVRIDKTAPTGTITLDETAWSKFLQTITFGRYKVQSLEGTVRAEDANGISKVEYAITEAAYASITELEAAGLNWETYTEDQKPTVKENENQIIYVRITDKAGNVSYICTDGIHVDTLAPEISVAVDMDSVTGSGFDLSITSSETGKYYYAVLGAAEAVPTAEELLSQNIPGAILGCGNLEQAGEPITVTVSGLEVNTPYTVYAVAEDMVIMLSDGSAAPNVSSVASSDLVVTARYSLENAQVAVEDMLYTGNPVTPAVEVRFHGKLLVYGQDYEVIYHNNVDVSATDPYVEIIGIGDYSGSVTKSFAISYLDAREYTVSGIMGNDGYYVSAVTIAANEGYELVAVENCRFTFSEDGTYETKFRIRRIPDGAMTDVYTLEIKVDITAPVGTVTVGTNTWTEFLNTITFGLFFKETQTVTIEASDIGSGLREIGYYISDTPLSLDQVKTLGDRWMVYEEAISITPDSERVIYARILDNAGHISYRSSDGLIVESTLPVIIGVEDGGTYYGDQTITVTDKYLDSVTVDGVEVALTDNTFILIADNARHTIRATDKAGNTTTVIITVNVPEDPVCDGITDCPSLAFTDLDTSAWYHLYTDYVIENHFMQGYSGKIFAPGDSMTRAMMVQVLYNLEGRPAVSGAKPYTDTLEDAWYFDAVLWANQNGLIKGYGNGKFGPDDAVSREQMVTIFYRYSECKGYSLTEGEYDDFIDKDDVSSYAQKAMRWAVGNGLIVGNGHDCLHPRENSTRAEFAAVLQRFVESIAK